MNVPASAEGKGVDERAADRREDRAAPTKMTSGA